MLMHDLIEHPAGRGGAVRRRRRVARRPQRRTACQQARRYWPNILPQSAGEWRFFAYSNAISWRSEATPVAKETDPRAVFERLFGSGDGEEEAESRTQRAEFNKSILDFVMDDAKSLTKQLGQGAQV